MNPNDEDVLKINQALSEILPWPLACRIQYLAHKKFSDASTEKWTEKDTANLLGRNFSVVKSSILLGKLLIKYPDLAKITNRRRAWRIAKLYRNFPEDTIKLKIAQEIQTQLSREKRQTYHELSDELRDVTI